MRERSVVAVLLLSILTGGIYVPIWFVRTKIEMNDAAGANIPSAWWLLVPIANLWWLWRYCVGVEQVTRRDLGAGVSFVLFMLVGFLCMAIVQSHLNDAAAGPTLPRARVA